MSLFSDMAFLHLQNTKPFKCAKNTIHREGFFPVKDPRTLHNCKQYFWLKPDGTKTHAAYLNPLDSNFREELILRHYITHVCRRIRSGIGFNILKRDKPWDFEIGFSSGITMNVEIVSITDRKNFFRILTAEELLQRHSYYAEIRVGILEKINRFFPDPKLTERITNHRQNGLSNSDLIENPFFPEKPKLFTSINNEIPVDFYQILSEALTKKSRKKHAGKDKTILLIDNRTTTATLTDFISATQLMQQHLRYLEFPEIWLYTGYGGVHWKNGSRLTKLYSDYLLIPMKLDDQFEPEYRNGRR